MRSPSFSLELVDIYFVYFVNEINAFSLKHSSFKRQEEITEFCSIHSVYISFDCAFWLTT